MVLQSVVWCVRVDHTGPTVCCLLCCQGGPHRSYNLLFAVLSGWTTQVLQSVVCCVVRVDHTSSTVCCLLCCQGGPHWSYSLLFAVLSGWTKLGPKQLIATMAFAAKILDDGELMELNPFYPGFDLLILDKASVLENLKFIFSFFTRKKKAVCHMLCVCMCTCVYVYVCVCMCTCVYVCVDKAPVVEKHGISCGGKGYFVFIDTFLSVSWNSS